MTVERWRRIIRVYIITAISTSREERGHTSSRGALCQYLADEGPARETKMCLTVYVSL
jgi:hypothetical protein